MDGSVLSQAERTFLEALNRRQVRYLLVGMSAALIQGARGATEDIDLWLEKLDDPRVGGAAREAGGFYVSGSFGLRPPALGGDELSDRFDIVTHMHGLRSFDEEYPAAIEVTLDGVPVRVLTLSRIIESKKATGRPRDRAQLPALEEALHAREEENG